MFVCVCEHFTASMCAGLCARVHVRVCVCVCAHVCVCVCERCYARRGAREYQLGLADSPQPSCQLCILLCLVQPVYVPVLLKLPPAAAAPLT